MSFYKEVPGRQTTLESTLKFDTEPKAGSTNPVTSGGVKGAIDGAVGDASEALQHQIDDIAEKASSGYIPNGEASVATLNGLSGQENGDLYTLTDAGTLTLGSLAVVAGDTVAWDATNEVWYKAMDYAPRQYGTNEVHNLPTTITTFRAGDYIAVDGTNTAKMLASFIATTDKLFALGDSVWDSSTYASLDDLPYGAVYIQGEIANKPTYGRACVITYTDRRDGNKSQIYTALDGSNISFIRSKLNGTWNDWIKLLSSFDFDGILNFISSSTRTTFKKETLVYTPSKYIGGYNAVVETNADYTMTSPIKVKPGETLMVQMSAGYQNVIAVFASYNSSTGTYSVIQRCPDSSQKVQFFFYRNSLLNEVDVVISMNRKYKPSFAYILSETSKDVEMPSLSCLDSFAGVGDSYTAGSVDVSGTLQDFGNKYSWVKVLGKNCGIPDSRVYAVQGYTTRHAKDHIIPAINADTPAQMYALCYGINDSGRTGYGMDYLGTPSDMDLGDYTQSADTFYGNYYYCIKAIQAHAPKAFLVMIMPASFSVTNSNPVYRSFREACVNIAAAAGIPCIDTSELYSNPIWTGMNNGHPTITGYSQQAVYYRNAMEAIIGPHSFDIML